MSARADPGVTKLEDAVTGGNSLMKPGGKGDVVRS
jgi:hypothetical protein